MITILMTLAIIARSFCVLREKHTSKDEAIFALLIAARCVAPFIDIGLSSS